MIYRLKKNRLVFNNNAGKMIACPKGYCYWLAKGLIAGTCLYATSEKVVKGNMFHFLKLLYIQFNAYGPVIRNMIFNILTECSDSFGIKKIREDGIIKGKYAIAQNAIFSSWKKSHLIILLTAIIT